MNRERTSDRLSAVLLSGLVLGTLGLLEPLIRFWDYLHLLGVHWSWLLLVYLGSGLAVSLAAGAVVSVWLATRAVQRRPVVVASYFVAGTFTLAAVLIAAPLVQHELREVVGKVSFAIIYPVLGVLGLLFAIKTTRYLVCPALAAMIAHPSGRISRARLILLLAIVGLLIPLTVFMSHKSTQQFGGRPTREGLQSRPSNHAIQNVVLITIEGLRADHLGVYGYNRPTSPVIDSLAAESVLFEHCFSQGNCTELSFGSLFTSLYPSMHSVKRRKTLATPLPEEFDTLAECLRDAGLRTIGLMTNTFLKREWNMTQGFDEIIEFHSGYASLLPVRYLLRLGVLDPLDQVPRTKAPRAEGVVDEAIGQLDWISNDPFFLFVHFMDTHYPYIPPRPYQNAFRAEGASPAFGTELWEGTWSTISMLPSDEELISQADLLRIADLYDGAIRYIDDAIGRLLHELDALGLSDNTILIITSDHGSEFFERGRLFHTNPFLYDELIHVPLLIRVPGLRQSRRVPEIVRHIDLMPTLVEIFDLPCVQSAQGQSLVPLLKGARGWKDVLAFSQSYEAISVRTRTHKVIHDLTTGESYCFDLQEDPGETTALDRASGEAPEEASPCDSLEVDLMKFFQRINVPPKGIKTRELDKRAQEQLRSLGYM
ncbi:MAG: sulfatase-like hydrolase/transferase [Candidatus Eisenbacteria sp.]|nr:sulfatase-like hydrolase/transferase [Candidatus Eisenbacteria bacterium]